MRRKLLYCAQQLSLKQQTTNDGDQLVKSQMLHAEDE